MSLVNFRDSEVSALRSLTDWWSRTGQRASSVVASNGNNGNGHKPDHSRARVRQFVVKSVGDDHLVCHSWNGTTEGPDNINVAKPYDLRRTPFQGKTFSDFRGSGESIEVTYAVGGRTRTLAHSDGTVTERIEPYWMGVDGDYVGDVIYAMSNVAGGNTTSVSDKDLQWTENNDSGRRWVEVDWVGSTFTTLLAGESETETAQSDTFARTQEFGVGLKFDVLMRVSYDSSNKLFAFYREFTVDKNGKIRSVAAESRVEIFDTDVC